MPLNNLFDKKTYIVLFAAFFAFEAVLSLWTGMGYDMTIWFNTGKWMQQGINIYMPPDHVGYPPLWPLWCDAAYRVYVLTANNLEVWRFTIKLPLILAHLALAFAVGEFAASRFDRKVARRVFLFVLAFGFFIYVGAMWGQINTLSALLTFMAFYALTRGRTKLSAVFLGLAVALKIYPLVVLPAFVVYVLKAKDRKEAGKYTLYTIAVPVVFTVTMFSVFRWDVKYLLQTVFYWAPIYQTTPIKITGGCMNVWSFASLLNFDIAQNLLLRLLWIPVMVSATLFWLKRPRMENETLCLSIVSLYVLFMITYAWVPEQMFVDPLPFVLLLIVAYRPRALYFFLLAIIQILIYAFSAMNWGPFVFTPFLERFYPPGLAIINLLNPSNSLVWTVRGILGLAVSLALGVFLSVLAKPSIIEVLKRRFRVS